MQSLADDGCCSHFAFAGAFWEHKLNLPALPVTTQRLFWLPKLRSKLGMVAVIPALGRLKQDDYKFKASLGYI